MPPSRQLLTFRSRLARNSPLRRRMRRNSPLRRRMRGNSLCRHILCRNLLGRKLSRPTPRQRTRRSKLSRSGI